MNIIQFPHSFPFSTLRSLSLSLSFVTVLFSVDVIPLEASSIGADSQNVALNIGYTNEVLSSWPEREVIPLAGSWLFWIPEDEQGPSLDTTVLKYHTPTKALS